MIWSDNFVIPNLAQHKKNAEILINYYYDPEVMAQVADYVNYIPPVKGVKEIFETWLEQHFPDRKDRVLNRIRDMRGSKLYDARFALRGKGEGKWAEQLESLFRVTRRKLDLERRPELSTASFRVPPDPNDPQTDLFAPSAG